MQPAAFGKVPKNQTNATGEKGNYRKDNYMSTSPCYSFQPGHNIHHQTIEKFNQPRTLVDVSHVIDDALLVTFNGFTEFWYHHNPKWLMDALTRSMPEGIEAT